MLTTLVLSLAGDATITELLQQAEQQGSTWVAGQMVDRVTATGELSPVQVMCYT